MHAVEAPPLRQHLQHACSRTRPATDARRDLMRTRTRSKFPFGGTRHSLAPVTNATYSFPVSQCASAASSSSM